MKLLVLSVILFKRSLYGVFELPGTLGILTISRNFGDNSVKLTAIAVIPEAAQ